VGKAAESEQYCRCFTQYAAGFASNGCRFTELIDEFAKLHCCFKEKFICFADNASDCIQEMIYSKEIIFGFEKLIVLMKSEKYYIEIGEPKFVKFKLQ